jgi:trimethylamine--corrinoid protein Co-methyltransferase
VSQMIREGTPAVYGTQSTLADMRSGAYVLASPEHALCLCAGARLAKFYGLPCRGGGGKSDAGFVSSRSGSESMLTMLATCTEGMNVVILSAGILDSAMAMSYEKFLLDLQIIAVAQRVARGVEINEQTLAMDAMYEVGPGGEYLTHDHTLNFCRAERWPTALDFGAIDSVITHEDMMQWLQTEKLARLNAYHQPDLAEDLQRDMKKYLIKAGFEAV